MLKNFHFKILLFAIVIFEQSLFAFGNTEPDYQFDPEAEPSESEPESAVLRGSSRNPKFFSIFHNGYYKTGQPGGSRRCVTPAGECGRCLNMKQCSGVEGGVPTDTKCPGNNGICCLIKLSWNQPDPGIVTVKHNLSHIVQSTRLPSQALFVIPRQKGVCQLRLDFKVFDLSPANQNGTGNCGTDTMTINGADNLNPPLQLCGKMNSTEHIYLHYGASDTISVNMDILNTSSKHDIFVTMIRCDSTEKAPDGCTQYYTQQRADVKSFNYPFQQLNNQHYSVCIEANRGSQSITWSTCNDPITDFFISGNAPGIVQTFCTGDRVTIPGSVNGTYCGGVFEEVQTSAKPFALYVDFDNLEISPPPTGPVQLNGCPIPFECLNPQGHPVIEAIPPDPPVCREPNQCVLDLTNPNAGALQGLAHDIQNTGFCLRYRKT